MQTSLTEVNSLPSNPEEWLCLHVCEKSQDAFETFNPEMRNTLGHLSLYVLKLAAGGEA